MGGKGSMASAILSLKHNRALLRKRNIKEIRDLIYEKSGKTELKFKEIRTEELAMIKKEIRKQARKAAKREVLINTILIILASGLFLLFTYYLYVKMHEL